ncbi:hypothetical protein Acr_24g0004310 [Actinidia rufa]|uniref:Uncharacterized protein n=1 Tax=Actinidia rufa TaxID=165716 RepID=A0A7J0GU33_9ERIC|nr:hypothetical protein Acr_24g0004310 [Actinidia rufa]
MIWVELEDMMRFVVPMFPVLLPTARYPGFTLKGWIQGGSANIRIGLAQQDTPFNIPHCITRLTTRANQAPRRNVQDQLLNSQVTTAQHMEREKAYDIIESLLKIPFLDEEVANNSYPRKMGRVDGYTNTPLSNKKETAFTWTNVLEKKSDLSSALVMTAAFQFLRQFV